MAAGKDAIIAALQARINLLQTDYELVVLELEKLKAESRKAQAIDEPPLRSRKCIVTFQDGIIVHGTLEI